MGLFALLVVIATNIAFVQVLLRRIDKSTELAAANSDVYRLSKRIAQFAQLRGPGFEQPLTYLNESASELDQDVRLRNNHPMLGAEGLRTALETSKEVSLLFTGLQHDWREFREAYELARKIPPSDAEAKAVILRLVRGADELQASAAALNFTLDADLHNLYNRTVSIGYALGAVDVLLILLLYRLFVQSIVRPVRELTSAAQRLSEADFSQQVAVRSNDEIGELATVLNTASERIGGLLRQAAEDARAIKEAEEKFRRLSEDALVGVFLIQGGHFLYVNRGFASIFGYQPDQIVGLVTMEMLVQPEERSKVAAYLSQQLTEDIASVQYSFRGLHRKGHGLYAEFYGSRIEYRGRPAIVGSIFDQTEKQAAEAELRKVMRAVEQSPTTVLITDCNGVIEYVNPRFSELTGYSAAEALGQTPRIVKSGHTSTETYRKIWEALGNGRDWSGELLNRRKNGELFWEYMVASPVRNSEGVITNFVAVKEDISVRKRNELELGRLNRMLQVLSACNMSLVRANGEDELLVQICRNLTVIGGYRLAYVGFATDDTASSVAVAASVGDDDHYHDCWTDKDRGRSLTGLCIRGRQTLIVRDILNDPHYGNWREEAARRGYASSIALPLIHDDEVLGGLRIMSAEVAAFNVEEVKLLEELAADLAYGLDVLRVRRERSEAAQALAASEERFRSISNSVLDGIVMCNSAWQINYCNPTAAQMFGAEAVDMMGRNLLELFAPAEHKRFAQGIGNIAAVSTVQSGPWIGRTIESQGWRTSGTAFPVELSPSTVFVRDAWHLVLTVRDLTERKQADEALKIRDRAIESSSNAIMIMKSSRAGDNPIVYVNPAFERITGYSEAEILGRNPRLLLGTDWDQMEVERLRDCMRNSSATVVTLRNYRKDGSLFWSELSFSPVLDEAGQVSHFVSVINDVTESARYREELQHLATHDTLTNLANRTLLGDRIAQALGFGDRDGLMTAILLLDLDRFKLINDSLGHGAGDRVIVEVARRIEGCVRGVDTVARLGGDEFVIVLAGIAESHVAVAVAAKILEAIRHPLRLDEQDLVMAASLGISLCPGDGNSAEVLLRNADAAMYKAKGDGGDCFRFYESHMDDHAIERLGLEMDLRQAIGKGELLVFYQPKVECHTGIIVGAEALVRWQHPSRGMVSPGEFVPLAEESGLIVHIGEWMIHEVASQAKRWLDAGLPAICVSVNVSARQFRQIGLVDHVRTALARTGIPADSIELELTESLLMHSIEDTIGTLRELKSIGVSISIDDFGTGYSSLSYLNRFPIDVLKVDRSFIKNVHTSVDDAVMTEMILVMARTLGMRTIAEGIEHHAQLEFLKDKGCDEIQGYIFSEPVSAEEFAALLRQGSLVASVKSATAGELALRAARTRG